MVAKIYISGVVVGLGYEWPLHANLTGMAIGSVPSQVTSTCDMETLAASPPWRVIEELYEAVPSTWRKLSCKMPGNN